MEKIMMYTCYICNKKLNLDLIANHLKIIHNSQIFKCGENDCHRVYSTSFKLKKHLTTHLGVSEPMDFQGVPTQFADLNEKSTWLTASTSKNIPESEPLLSPPTNFTAKAKNVDFLQQALLMALKLHGYRKMPRYRPGEIMRAFYKLIIEPLSELILQNCEEKSKMKKLLEVIKKQFKSLDNERKLIKLLKEKDVYVEPETITVQESNDIGLKQGISQVIAKKTTVTKLSLKDQLKKIFEVPDNYKRIMDHVNYLNEKPNLTSYMQSTHWLRKKDKINKSDGAVLPYFLYFDGMNPDNPLGSHRKTNCLEDGFVKLPFLPIEFDSKLEKILVVYNYKSTDKIYGNKMMLNPLIFEMIKLEEEGVNIMVNDETKKVLIFGS
jgi:hypothetical protein